MTPRRLSGINVPPSNIAYSPDGRWIAFLSRSDARGSIELRKVPANGGPATFVVGDAGSRFTWAPDGSIVFMRNLGGVLDGLWRVGPSGGEAHQVVRADSSFSACCGSPIVFPDNKTLLFTVITKSGDFALAGARLGDSRVTPLGISGGNPTYLAADLLAFSRPDGRIAAVRFDAKHLRALGEPVVVLDSIALKAGLVAELAVAPNGTLAYLPGPIGGELGEVDRHGNARVLISTVQTYNSPRLSPDGRRIAWTSLARGREGIWWQPWDRSATPALLVPGGRGARFGPRGDFVLASFVVGNGAELRMVPLPFDSGKSSRTVLASLETSVGEVYQLSRDGNWLAFISRETGTPEVYIQSFPGPGGRFQISTAAGARRCGRRAARSYSTGTAAVS